MSNFYYASQVYDVQPIARIQQRGVKDIKCGTTKTKLKELEIVKDMLEDAPDNVIEHAGRKGMKWYQNIFTKKDGSSKTKKQSESDDPSDKKSKISETVKKAKSKSLSELSDQELADMIRRLNNEKQLKTLIAEATPSTKSKGRKFMEAAGSTVGKGVQAGAQQAVADASKKMMSNMLDSMIKNASKK